MSKEKQSHLKAVAGLLRKYRKTINIMKNYMYIYSILLGLTGCINPSSEIEKPIKIDSLKSSKAEVVIKARLLNFEGGDKYHYSNIHIHEILLNKTNYNLGDHIRIAHYNWNQGIPNNKDCIIYIVPWPLGSSTLNEKEEWMLIEGNGAYACECE